MYLKIISDFYIPLVPESGELIQKGREIEDYVNGGDVTVERLREYALSEGGFVNGKNIKNVKYLIYHRSLFSIFIMVVNILT